MKKWFRPLPIDWLEWTLALALLSLVLQVTSPEIGAWLNRPRPGRQVAQRDGAYPYLVYLPERWDSSPEHTTLLLSLHGSGARGADLDPRRLGGPASLIADGKSFPMIVVSPQCPVDHAWEAERLRQLLEHLQTRFQPQRVVVTGYSMGGGGTWEFAQTYPELVDAAAPVCGCGNPTQAKRLKNVPVWAFHGALDDVIPIRCSRDMVEAINAGGGTAKLTTFPEHSHGISRTVYDNPKFYRWVLDPRHPEASPSTGAAAP